MNFSLIMRSQEKNIVSITNKMIETHHSDKRYYNYFEGIIKTNICRFQRAFDIHTDASYYQIGAVINQSPSTAIN